MVGNLRRVRCTRPERIIGMTASWSEGPSVKARRLPGYISGGRQVVRVGEERLYSNEELIPAQPYPGAVMPWLSDRVSFPLPDQVGVYGTYSQFRAAPKFMAQWVHWPERARLILEGRYFDVPPAHFEGIFTLVCNYMCPHCTRRVTRTNWVEGGTWKHSTPNERRNTMHIDDIKSTLDQLAAAKTDGQMGVVWGGGDPTANPFTYEGMRYATEKGISSSLLTNGSRLNVDACLEAEPTLVRISLNCGTTRVYNKFHGLRVGADDFEQVVENLKKLAYLRQSGVPTLIGVSLIADERNLDDLADAVGVIRDVVNEVGPGIDYVIARPVMNYAHFPQRWARLRERTKTSAEETLSPGGECWQVLDDLGIPLILVKDSFDEPPTDDFYEQLGGTDCLAFGLYGEIRHDGTVQFCSDSYGNPQYAIGNLLETSLDEVWQSDRRRQVWDDVNRRRCFATHCAHNSRGHHHNRLFHQIEKLRAEGRIDMVKQWVDDLRECTLPLGHSFFV